MITYPHNANSLPAHIKNKARAMLTYALQCGLIERPECCQHCDKICTPEGHHTNYFEPLNVVWLCKSCHGEQHPDLAIFKPYIYPTKPPQFKPRPFRRPSSDPENIRHE